MTQSEEHFEAFGGHTFRIVGLSAIKQLTGSARELKLVRKSDCSLSSITMSATVSRGRPQASTREVLAEAACELFLERGYDATSVADLAKRVGVSRSSFFNYFDGKDAILWFALDERIAHLLAALADDGSTLDEALAAFGEGAAPESLLVAILNADAMGVQGELAQGRAVRQMRIADALTRKLQRAGISDRKAEIIGAGIAGALLAAVWEWAKGGSGLRSLDQVLAESLEIVREVFAGAI